MRLSPPFDNTAPASVTPSRGAAFDDLWWPQLRYQSKAFFEASNRPSWSPVNANASTVNGWVISGGSTTAFCDSTASGSFSGIANSNAATLFSVAITPQTVYPLLLATCGGFSFYAATAGVACGPNPYVTVAGSAFITGPNGYTSTGHFRSAVGLDPDDEVNPFQQPYDFIELQVYAQEAGLTARQSNTAPSSVVPARGAGFNNTYPFSNYTSRLHVESFERPTWSPANATVSTVNGITTSALNPNAVATENSTGTFAPLLGASYNAKLHSIVVNHETVYPLLIASCQGFSVYATKASVSSFPAQGNYPATAGITGSALITGPNGYTSIGNFAYDIGPDGEDQSAFPRPYDIWGLWVYAQEAGLRAQPSNATPTSVVPSRGAAFGNGAPALNSSFPRTQLRASADNQVPQLKVVSQASWQYFPDNSLTSWSPSNATPFALRNGVIYANQGDNFIRLDDPQGALSSAPLYARFYSFAITKETSYPLLLLTAGGFSFYATSAGVQNSSNLLRVSGSCLITGPNGFSALGYFYYEAFNDEPESVPYTTYSCVYFNLLETPLAAQPTNTPPQPRQ